MSDNIVYSGFFNRASGESDRLYNAQHFSKFFDGLICDGVYVNFPQSETDPTEKAFYVKATSGMGIKVAKGRAWFLGTYTYTEADCTFTLDQTASSLQSRIDAVVLDINVGDAVRMNDIVIVKGTEGTTPDRPTLINEPTHKQLPIAFIRIPGGATSILQTNITQTVGTSDADAIPAVEALLEYSSKSKEEIQNQLNAITAPTFTEAETVENINTGENINTLWGKIKKMFSIILNKLPVQYGGTGKNTLTSNAVLLGNGTSAVKEKYTGNGAFYATGNNAEPQFGVLPIAQGGTGGTTRAEVLANLEIPSQIGDAMLKATYLDNDIMKQSKGGTGSNDGTINGVKLGLSGTTRGYYDAGGTFRSFRQPTGNAGVGQVVAGYTFANASSDALTGTFAAQQKTVTGSRSAQTVTPDSGKYLSKVTVNKYPDANGTYTASSRGASLDMGASNNYRYVNTNSVPNTNSGTYTFPANDTGGTKDLGATNTYRYVNASNVYDKGVDVGHSQSNGTNRALVVRVSVSGDNAHVVVKYSANSGMINRTLMEFDAMGSNYNKAQNISTGYNADIGINTV